MAASQVPRPTFFPAFLLRVGGPPTPVFERVRKAAPEVRPDINLDFAVLATNIDQTLQRERLVAMLSPSICETLPTARSAARKPLHTTRMQRLPSPG